MLSAGAVFTMHKTADSSARHVWYSPSGNVLKWAVQRVSSLPKPQGTISVAVPQSGRGSPCSRCVGAPMLWQHVQTASLPTWCIQLCAFKVHSCPPKGENWFIALGLIL